MGITLAVVALALAGFFFWRRNKLKSSQAGSTDLPYDKHNNNPNMVSPNGAVGSYYSADKTPVYAEAPHEQVPAELPNGPHQRHEMA